MNATLPASATMTADDLLKLSNGACRYELIRGEQRTRPPAGSEHGATTLRFSWRLAQFVEQNQLGVTFVAETGFRIATDPDTVRAPDLAFVRTARIPEGGLPRGYFPGAPDLAVEVISPGDTVEEVEDKIEQWLKAGTILVWIVNPRRRSVSIHRRNRDVRILREGDEMDGEDLLPGFSLPVAEIFM